MNIDTCLPVAKANNGVLTEDDFDERRKYSETVELSRGGSKLYSPLWSADRSRIQRMAPIEFMGRYMKDWFDFSIADEVHQLAGDTAQGNGLAELPNSDIIVSFRIISTVIIIDRQTGKINWKLGAPPLCGQHAPTPLPNGNLLIFDNGPHRWDHPMPFSRVIEVEPATKQIVWKYQEKRESDFFSPRISNAQRLPNGNTLICEGDFGRIFEVMTNGELIWEFVNPYFGEGPSGPNNRVFRAYRYSKEELARAKATGGDR